MYFAQLMFSSWGSGRPDTIIAKNDIKNNETISQKEIELREIINNNYQILRPCLSLDSSKNKDKGKIKTKGWIAMFLFPKVDAGETA